MQLPTQVKGFHDEAGKLFCHLYDRWQNEKEYENIDLYMLPLSSIANEHGVQIVAMTGEPFALTFTHDGRTFKMIAEEVNDDYVAVHLDFDE